LTTLNKRVFLMMSFALLFLLVWSACVKEKVVDPSTFRISINDAVKDALKGFPYNFIKFDDKLVLVPLQLGDNQSEKQYFPLIKQGLISGLSSKVLCQDKVISEVESSEDTTTFPLNEKSLVRLKKDTKANKLLAYRPLEFIGLPEKGLFKVRVYLRLIKLGDISDGKITPKAIWSGILTGTSRTPTDEENEDLNKSDNDLYVKIYEATVNAVRGILPKSQNNENIFIQPLGDYSAHFADQKPLSAQKALIREKFQPPKRYSSSFDETDSSKPQEMTAERIYMAIEDGIISAILPGSEGQISEKSRIPAFRFPNQFKVLAYYSAPFQFLNWSLLMDQTASEYVLFYRILQIVPTEPTSVTLYLRLVDLTEKGEILWSGIVTGVSDVAESEREEEKASDEYLAFQRLHEMAAKAASQISPRVFSEGDHIVVLNASQRAKDLRYGNICSNELAIEDGFISGLNAITLRSGAAVVDKIPSLYVFPQATAYFLTKHFLDPIRDLYGDISKLITYEVLQINYKEGEEKVAEKVPCEYLLDKDQKDIENIRIEINIIDVKQGALVYSSILSSN